MKRYDVKRGLRATGTARGVLVGLTEIGDVHGYMMEEGDKIPVNGVFTLPGGLMSRNWQKVSRRMADSVLRKPSFFCFLATCLPKDELDLFRERLGENAGTARSVCRRYDSEGSQ